MCGAAAWALSASGLSHFSITTNVSGPNGVWNLPMSGVSVAGPYSMQPFSACTAGILARTSRRMSSRMPDLAVMMAMTWIMGSSSGACSWSLLCCEFITPPQVVPATTLSRTAYQIGANEIWRHGGPAPQHLGTRRRSWARGARASTRTGWPRQQRTHLLPRVGVELVKSFGRCDATKLDPPDFLAKDAWSIPARWSMPNLARCGRGRPRVDGLPPASGRAGARRMGDTSEWNNEAQARA